MLAGDLKTTLVSLVVFRFSYQGSYQRSMRSGIIVASDMWEAM